MAARAPARAPAKKPKIRRRRPIQGRSQATYEALLTATAQILVRRGAEATTTNAIAARAGVSIGSLYQYFADRDALVLELIRRHVAAMTAVVVDGLAAIDGAALEDVVRPVIGALVAAHRVAPRLHQALHQIAPPRGAAALDDFEDAATGLVATALRGREDLEIADPELAARVLVMAIGGVMRTTLRREPAQIAGADFEAMLVALVLGFLGAIDGRTAAR